LFYQSLAGVWPVDMAGDNSASLNDLAERLVAYMLKVVREAKLRTSWTAPVAAYEDAVTGFVRGALSDRPFIKSFRRRAAPLWLGGVITSLAQLAVKIAAPGVPDIYQGTEFWDLSLVDPDNRRPVDFNARRAALDSLDAASPEELLGDWRSGRLKMRLVKSGLALRRDHPALFGEGEYVPLEVVGEAADHLIAFARHFGDEWAIVVATRLPLALLDTDIPLVEASAWGDTRILLPEGAQRLAFRDVTFGADLAGAVEIPAAAALARFPVALLYGTAAG
jgi:(1->4)-alpha-D-glucan 1-alpha-D-glucosylmutase